jgi:Mrp family chromosome partitioning ATPase
MLIATTLALKQSADSQHIRVIGLQDTATGANSGVVASNIAFLNARAGKQTLLIDADVSKTNLASQMMTAPPRYSLQDVLKAKVAVTDAIVQSPMSSKLHYLLAAGGGESCIDQIGMQLRAIIDGVRDFYDLVLVHLPVAGVGDHASIVVDGMVVVCKARETKLPELTNIAVDLRLASKPLLGIIISGIA